MNTTAASPRARCVVTSDMTDVVEWEQTSVPAAFEDKRRGVWKLRLQYTESKKRATRRVCSRGFATREEAEAAMTRGRLSWEQGHKGERIHQHVDPDEVTMDAVGIPRGEYFNLGVGNNSTTLTQREKRCLNCGWTRREANVNKQFQNRHAYIKRQAAEAEARVSKNDEHIGRLRECLLANVNELLLDDDICEGESEDGGAAAAGIADHGAEKATLSASQTKRLVVQAMAVLEVMEEVRVRNVLVRDHLRTALGALSQNSDAGDQVAKTALEDVSLVRLHNSLLLVAERVSNMKTKYAPSTILSWERQFRTLGGYFKRDCRGLREREWILSEEDLSMELLRWLKEQKRVTTKKTHKFVNEQLFAREGGLLKLAEYGLSLPISTTTINVWMHKLGCKHDKGVPSHAAKAGKLALRKPCWVLVEWSSLTEKEKQAFDERRETGEDAATAETYHFERGGKEYVEFHVDFLGGSSDQRHDELRNGLGLAGGNYSVRFGDAAWAPRQYF
eukprot:jgi/Undpi1/9368/HiC_scaffold_26.g11826.m1